METATRHIAIIAPPTPGHLNPLQVLGAELVAIGHRVTIVHVGGASRYVTSPQIGFAELRGPDVPFDAYLSRLAAPTGPIGLNRMIRATAAITGALLEGAPAVLERIGADAVIADSVEPAGPLVARRVGVPHVVSITGLPLLREDDIPPPFLGWTYRPDRLGRVRNRGGHAVANLLMRPITTTIRQRQKDWQLDGAGDAPLAYIAQCPRSLDYPRRELPPGFHYGGPWRSVPADEPDLPVDRRPLIFCSLGTLQGSRRALFATIAAACAAIGARAVIGHGGGLTAAEEASLPGDPLVKAFWSQEQVLRVCAAAVLHGGFNSVLDALAAGVPTVCIPIAFEQPGTAARLARVGAGLTVPPARLTVPRLARALTDVMQHPGYRRAALLVAAEMEGAGGARRAAARISAALTARA